MVLCFLEVRDCRGVTDSICTGGCAYRAHHNRYGASRLLTRYKTHEVGLLNVSGHLALYRSTAFVYVFDDGLYTVKDTAASHLIFDTELHDNDKTVNGNAPADITILHVESYDFTSSSY